MMRLDQKLKVQLPLALGLSLVSGYLMTLPGNTADSNDVSLTTSTTNAAAPDASSLNTSALNTPALNATPAEVANTNTDNTSPATTTTNNTANQTAVNKIAIRDIYLNDNKQLVVEFDNPSHIIPASPQVRDYPGQQHDIVLEFSQTSFAVDKAPKAKALLDELMKAYPSLNSIAYATANDGTKARIRIGILPNISAHPALASIGEGSAIINLDLPTGNKNDDTNKVVNSNTEVNENKEKIVANKNANTPNSETGITTKTVNNIKGAWRSSLKLGHNQVNKISQITKLSDKINPIGKFGHAKNADKLSMPANADIASSVTPKNPSPPVSTIPEAPVQTAADAVNALPTTTATSTVATTSTTTSTSAITNDVVGVENTATNSELKSAINPPTSQPTEQLSSSALNKNEPTSITPADKTQLARISPVFPEDVSITANNEPIITPLSVEQVLKEKASLPTEQQKMSLATVTNETNLGQPITTKETNDDNSVASDLKTSFSQPTKSATPEVSTKEADAKEANANVNDLVKKDETLSLASATPNSLDKLTNAAMNSSNGAEETSNTSGTAPLKDGIPLKAQKASIGGKDYLPPKFSDEAVDHYNKAVRFHLSGKLPDAVVEYKAAIEADPKIAEAYSNLGLIYNQQRKYDQAMTEFHKALVINPKDAITYNGIGAAMRAKNNMVAAKKNWKTAITLDPNLASAHYNLGTAYELEKDMEQALVEYKEAVKHDDKLGEAYYRMGLVLQKMNNKNLALEEYKRAIKISQQANYAPDAKKRINLLSQSKHSTM